MLRAVCVLAILQTTLDQRAIVVFEYLSTRVFVKGFGGEVRYNILVVSDACIVADDTVEMRREFRVTGARLTEIDDGNIGKFRGQFEG